MDACPGGQHACCNRGAESARNLSMPPIGKSVRPALNMMGWPAALMGRTLRPTALVPAHLATSIRLDGSGL
jgi:hypothetical protein